jgi:pimeloyl-ACP methyl ester carboxylesterase
MLAPLGRYLEERHAREVIPVAISPGFKDLSVCARSASERLGELWQDPTFEYADIVAHSMGGLVASHMLKRLPCGQLLRRVVTLGTPHRGTPLAGLGTLLLGRLCKALPQMRPSSPFLRELHAHGVPPGSELISVAGRSDLLVSEGSARLDAAPGQRNYELAGVDHWRLLTARSARRCVSALLDAPAANATQARMHGPPSSVLAAA